MSKAAVKLRHVPPATATTTVEIDTSLLERLRARHPGKADRAMIEDIARIDLDFSMLRQAKQRNAPTEDDATEIGVSAVHETRRSVDCGQEPGHSR